MSDEMTSAVAELNQRMQGSDYDGTAKFVVEGQGTIMIDGTGAREGDEPADVTLTADADTFREILSGETNSTAAFMSGKLKVDGDMGQAMKLATVLS